MSFLKKLKAVFHMKEPVAQIKTESLSNIDCDRVSPLPLKVYFIPNLEYQKSQPSPFCKNCKSEYCRDDPKGCCL